MQPDPTLDAYVKPAGWANPTPASKYDLVVLGAGTAGLVTAVGAAGLGAKVALVERDRLGGDCLNVGCVPSKAMIASARAAAAVRAAGEYGVRVGGDVTVDFPAVMQRMRRLRAGIAPHDSAARFTELGVDVFLGEAAFVSQTAVTVGGATLHFRRAAICTGGRPAAAQIAGLAESSYLTNETIFDLHTLPPRLAVLGGGPIGCELAQAFARFGSQVTLIERGDRVLGKDDPDAAELVRQALLRDGVTLRLGCEVERVEQRDGAHLLTLSGDAASGNSAPLVADALLVALGRQPNVAALNLPAAGVAFDEHGVTVDDALRTSNASIFAAGDVASRFKFTHAADALARLVIRGALFPGGGKASGLTIPWCTYTSPELAHVGLTVAQAAERGVTIDTFTQPFAKNDRAILDGVSDGFARVHLKAGSDTIVGGTVVDEHAGDLIGYLAAAMTQGIGLKALGETIFPYPTRAGVFRALGDAYNRTRLTPTTKTLIGTWLRWGW